MLKKPTLVKGTDLEAAEKIASEIGRDFSPGITGAKSMRALAPGTLFSPLYAGDPPLSAARTLLPRVGPFGVRNYGDTLRPGCISFYMPFSGSEFVAITCLHGYSAL